MNKFARFIAPAKRAGVAVMAAAGSALAMADTVTIPDATASLTQLQGNASGYSTPLFALALVATGIMVGVKWIKRGKSAA